MGKDYLYSGVFFEPEVITRIRAHLGVEGLEKPIPYPHVTFNYGSTVNTDWFGSRIKVTLTGYGNDGKNEAVSVEVNLYDAPKMRGLIPIIAHKKLHITLSVAKDGQPKMSNYLSFTPIPKMVVYGRYGAFEQRHFVVADSIVAEELRRNTMPLIGIIDGKHTVAAKTLTALKQKASLHCNQLHHNVDTMVVVPAADKAYLLCRNNGTRSNRRWATTFDTKDRPKSNVKYSQRRN